MTDIFWLLLVFWIGIDIGFLLGKKEVLKCIKIIQEIAINEKTKRSKWFRMKVPKPIEGNYKGYKFVKSLYTVEEVRSALDWALNQLEINQALISRTSKSFDAEKDSLMLAEQSGEMNALFKARKIIEEAFGAVKKQNKKGASDLEWIKKK